MALLGSNASDVRLRNRSTVLRSILRAGEISRVEIANDVGLSAQAVTNIVRELLDEHLIEVAGKARTKPGKPRTMLRINPESRIAIGVHIDPAITTVILVGLTGEVLHESHFPTPDPRDPSRVIDLISKAVDSSVAATKIPRESILGIGVTAPGPVDVESGVILSPPHLPGWDRVELADLLSEATGLPVELSKDTTAAGAAEAWRLVGDPLNSTGIIYIGTGIGVCGIINGKVLRGASGNAGDIGHVVVESGPSAPKCECGSSGCVTVTASPSALLARARAAGLDLPAGPTSDALPELFALEAQGDPVAEEIVHSAVRGVRKLGHVVADMFDADRLVLGGPFASLYSGAFWGEGPEATSGSGPIAQGVHPLDVEQSPFGGDICAIGAAIMVVDQFLTA